jgi:hypothetical protein
MVKTVAYWIATGLIAFFALSGGVAELMHVPAAGMRILGYPDYVMSILGFWKIVGTIVLLAPGLARAKEWAYAGFFIDFTGAAASHAAAGDYGAGGFHLITTVVLALVTVASWALRPPSRTLGVLFPA